DLGQRARMPRIVGIRLVQHLPGIDIDHNGSIKRPIVKAMNYPLVLGRVAVRGAFGDPQARCEIGSNYNCTPCNHSDAPSTWPRSVILLESLAEHDAARHNILN